MKHVGRGLYEFCRFHDSKGSEISVQTSSAINGPYCWVFTRNDPEIFEHPEPHLSVAQAKRLIVGLEKFIKAASA